MVLGNKDLLVSCACSAGPAFEGGGISFGMQAKAGVIDRAGKFQSDLKTPRLRAGDQSMEFVLAWKDDAGQNSDIVIAEGDVKNLLRAKIGNSSVKGACLALLSTDAYHEAVGFGQKMTYMELAAGNTFMDEYISAMFLPHTDLSLFPSLEKVARG